MFMKNVGFLAEIVPFKIICLIFLASSELEIQFSIKLGLD